MMGTNDEFTNDNYSEVMSNICYLINVAKSINPKLTVILCTILNDDFNDVLFNTFKDKYNICDFMDEEQMDTTLLDDDGCHFNHDGKIKFLNAIYSCMEKE